MVLVGAFTLRALKRAFFDTESSSVVAPEMDPITLPEKLGAALLMIATLAIGIYPKMLLDRIQPAVEAMGFLTK
ncbi:MAG TPA: hypothetical protein VJ721_08555 [Chthoniobacterales bacterium]|nr:hypothetical protein [Chthoniobacterales bacterium]